MSYQDLSAELAGVVPGLSPLLAQTYIRRAWGDIRNARNWSFETDQATLVCPAAIGTGTVALVQYQSTLTFDATATAALTPFVNGTPDLTTLQIRFAGGPLYRILTVTQANPLIVTVDRPINEATNALAAYSVYRAYIAPPTTDFSRWESLQDYANGVSLTGIRLTRTSIWFDQRDPQRTAGGLATYLGSFIPDPSGRPLYELWPHPTGGQVFTVTFKHTGQDFFAPGDTQPTVIPDALIMSRALGWYAYPWAQMNKGRFPDLQKADLVNLVTETRKQYEIDLNTTRLVDDDRSLQSVYNQGHRGSTRSAGQQGGLIGDAKYWQSHPIVW